MILKLNLYNCGPKSPLRTRACKPTASLTSICRQTEVNDHQGGLGVTCDQVVESISRSRLSRPELSLQTIDNPILHNTGMVPIPSTCPKTLLHWEPNHRHIPYYEFKTVNTYMYETKVKSSNVFYNRRETRDKRLLGRDPYRSWCHLYTIVKRFLFAAHGSMDIDGSTRVCCRSVHGSMGYDQESFTQVWWWRQLLFGSLPNRRYPESHVGCRLGRELITLPVCCGRCPWNHELRSKKLYHTRSVAVTPAPVRVPTQRPLVPSFTYAKPRTFHLALMYN